MSVNLNFPNIVGTDTSDATATASDIAVGKTAYVNGAKVTGTKDWVDTSDATATASDIAVGKTAYVNGVKVTGTKEDAVQDVVWVDEVSGSFKSERASNVYWSNIHSFIKKINIPNGINSVGDYAFVDCSKLEIVTIPDTVKSIGGSVFAGCIKLESITLPNTLTSIGSYAFSECSNLANIYYKGTEEQWNAISKGEYWNRHMGDSVTGGTVIHYNS